MGIRSIAKWAHKHIVKPVANKFRGDRSDSGLEARGRTKGNGGPVLADGHIGGSQGKSSNIRLT